MQPIYCNPCGKNWYGSPDYITILLIYTCAMINDTTTTPLQHVSCV